MEGDRVHISRDGARLILEPVFAPPRLTAVLAELGSIDEEFPDRCRSASSPRVRTADPSKSMRMSEYDRESASPADERVLRGPQVKKIPAMVECTVVVRE